MGCCYLPLIQRIKKKKTKEWKGAIPVLSPNIFFNDSDQTSSFKLLKSFSLKVPNLVSTRMGQLKPAGSVAPNPGFNVYKVNCHLWFTEWVQVFRDEQPHPTGNWSISLPGSGIPKSPVEHYPMSEGHYSSTEALTVVMNGSTWEEKCLDT